MNAKPGEGLQVPRVVALRDECEVALSMPFGQRGIQHGDAFYEDVLTALSALERIGRCCGNANFVANEALGYGGVAHPDVAPVSGRAAP